MSDSFRDVLLNVTSLQTQFATEDGVIKAVDGISFQVRGGETLGIVGESGCGKSITALSVMQLVPRPQGRIVGGRIEFRFEDGQSVDIASLERFGSKMRSLRGKHIAMIFQEPMTSLNPLFTIGHQVVEAVRLHQQINRREAEQRAVDMLRRVGIAAPEQRVMEYPHQLSGGMRQRAMIGMALSCNPDLLIADEPTTALDVTIQAQIIDLLRDLQQDFGMSILIITHDLGVIGEMAERVIVMYLGKVVEEATAVELFHQASHPYTKGLLQSIPKIGRRQKLVPIKGSVPRLNQLPKGCYFSPRCSEAMAVCKTQQPPYVEVRPGHFASCWLYADEKVGSA